MSLPYPSNPAADQDRAEDLLDNWRKYGYVMFPQQRAIYERLASRLFNQNVLEAGCGAGIGTALLARYTCSITGTDVLHRNVEFARCLYPWLDWSVWDLMNPWHGKPYEVVVSVEAVEHVADPRLAIRHLIGAARKDVWFSTPNGYDKPRPPANPQHVVELTPFEVKEAVLAAAPGALLEVWHWARPQLLPLSTAVDPLLYRVIL